MALAYRREKVNLNKDGTITGQDMSKLNKNFENIMYTINGNIDFSNVDDNLKNKICKQYFSFNCKENFDKDNPSICRFFIPFGANINEGQLNAVLSNYKIDSVVGSTTARTVPVTVNVQSESTETNPVHSHNATGSVSIPALTPSMSYEIRVSTTNPLNAKILVNDIEVSVFGSDRTLSQMSIMEYCREGWNEIKTTTTTIGNIDLYGFVGCYIDNDKKGVVTNGK